MTEQSEYIFHYTSVESLALILKNKTLRFSPLSNMDDLEEGSNQEYQGLRHNYFISSWTIEDNESIPMWKMYASLESGVRIKLRKYPFKKHDVLDYKDDQEFLNKNGVSIDDNFKEIPDSPMRYMVQPLEKLLANDYSFQQIFYKEDNLIEIIYTDNDDLINPSISKILEEKGLEIDTTTIGKYKRKVWEFQKECRYIIPTLPRPMSEMVDNYESMFIDLLLQSQPRVNYIDLEISDDAFADMVITLSPQISSGNRIIVESIIKEFNINSKLELSILTGKIR